MRPGFFITGTDTNAGKTWATVALMHYFKKQGKSVAGMKPVASGSRLEHGKLFNEDALLLQANASKPIPYNLINPYAYELALSPHLAGLGHPASLEVIKTYFNKLKQEADIVLVEGAGGWYTPINERQDIGDMARSLALPVILVVAIRLGCINHAKLTLEAIQRSSLRCAGWIAVCLNPDTPAIDDTILSIKQRLDIPFLGILPFIENADFDWLAAQLKL